MSTYNIQFAEVKKKYRYVLVEKTKKHLSGALVQNR